MCGFDCKCLHCQVFLKSLNIILFYKKSNLSDKSLEELVKESDILENIVGTDEYEDRIKETTSSVRKILEYKRYINVFKIEHEQDIEMTILRALLNCIIE